MRSIATTSVRSLRRSAACWAGLFASLAVLGCADNRLTVEELRSLERESRDVPPVAVEPAQFALTEVNRYEVGPGDILTVTMLGLTENPYTPNTLRLRVYPDGTVQMPLVGGVQVAHMDLPAVERAIIAAHIPKVVKEGMSVFAELAGPDVTTVVVMGAAGQRGLVTLSSNERNVLYALVRAQGFAPGTSGTVRVKPIQPDQPERKYDLTDVNDLRRALTAPPLQSGDLVMVDAASAEVVYVIGLVNAPSPVPVPRDSKLSTVRALAATGGLRDFLEPEEATVWRKLPSGQQVRVRLNIGDIVAGKAPDFELAAGDVLDIPHTAKTRVREWVQRNVVIGPFTARAGLSANYDPIAEDRFDRLNSGSGAGGFRQSVLDTVRLGLPDLLVPQVTEVVP